MPFLDPKTVTVIRTLAFFTLLAAFAYAARHTLELLIFAIFFAYLMEPIVARVQRWRVISRGSRGIAIAEVYVVLAMCITGIVFEIAPTVSSQTRNLIAAAPALLDQTTWQKMIRQISSTQNWSYHTQVVMEHLVSQHRAAIITWIQEAVVKLEDLVTNVFWLILVPILAIFLLNNGRDFAESGVRILRLRPRAKAIMNAALRELNDMAAHYIRAQVVLAALALPVYTIVLVASGLQYGLILGLFAAIVEFIPMVGPLLGATAILGTAFLTGFHFIWLLVLFLGVWRLIQDYVNSPKLMHRSVKLHPFAVIIAVLAGGEIGGIVGVFLSVPVAASLQIVWRRWRASSFALSNDNPQPTAPERQAA